MTPSMCYNRQTFINLYEGLERPLLRNTDLPQLRGPSNPYLEERLEFDYRWKRVGKKRGISPFSFICFGVNNVVLSNNSHSILSTTNHNKISLSYVSTLVTLQ